VHKAADPARVLEINRRTALSVADQAGGERTRALLKRAQADLERRLKEAEGLKGPGADSFTAAQLNVTLGQVHAVLGELKGGMARVVVGQGRSAAVDAVGGTLAYLNAAEQRFRGVNQALPLREASMLDPVVRGTDASVLRRILSDPTHRGHKGVLDRYGDNVISRFEEQLQLKFVARKPWEEVKQSIVKESPFLQGVPGFWAERIVRTETMAAYSRASWETIRQADSQLGDMVKILSATFDARTGADSVAVHGQIRRPEEAFESWFGLYQHPPNRPNDREVVVPHRISWPIPASLAPRGDGEIAAAWSRHGNSGAMPGRPNMTTVPLDLFGKPQAPVVQQPQAVEPASPEPVEQWARPGVLARAMAPTEFEMPEATSPAALPPDVGLEQSPPKDALERLDELPIDANDMVTHSLKAVPKSSEVPFLKNEELMKVFSETYSALNKSIAEGKAPKAKEYKNTSLVALGKTVGKEFVASAIASPGQIPVVVKYKKAKFIVTGLHDVVAQQLKGNTSTKVHVVDLDKAIKAKGIAAQKTLPASVAVAIEPAKPAVPFHELPKGALPDTRHDRGYEFRRDLNRKLEADYQAKELKAQQKTAIGAFSKGYDWIIRATESGMSDEEIIRQEMSHRGYSREMAAERLSDAKRYSEQISKTFDKLTPQPMTTYRGIGNLSEEVFQKFVADGEFEIGSTTSTSWDPNTAKGFLKSGYRVFFTFEQRSGIGIEPLSKFPHENEVLLRKGARFRVTSKTRVDATTLHIEAEEF
jgi:hypothetical protein